MRLGVFIKLEESKGLLAKGIEIFILGSKVVRVDIIWSESKRQVSLL